MPLDKIRAFLERENPSVPSLISECLDAGTGCGWCVPYLEQLHQKHAAGEAVELDVDHEKYSEQRVTYNKTGERPA